jgi:hypothetical protein
MRLPQQRIGEMAADESRATHNADIYFVHVPTNSQRKSVSAAKTRHNLPRAGFPVFRNSSSQAQNETDY